MAYNTNEFVSAYNTNEFETMPQSTGDSTVQPSTSDSTVQPSTGDSTAQPSTGDSTVQPSTGDLKISQIPDEPKTNYKVVEKVEFKFNDKTYKLGLDDKEQIINLFVVERNFLFYLSIILMVIAAVAFIYDFFMDFGDNIKGFKTMWKGDSAKGFAVSQGFTKQNVKRNVAKFALLTVSIILFLLSQRDVLVDNETFVELFLNEDFLDVSAQAYLDYYAKKYNIDQDKVIEKFINSIFYKLKKHNKLVLDILYNK
jgi:hypothetical protein